MFIGHITIVNSNLLIKPPKSKDQTLIFQVLFYSSSSQNLTLNLVDEKIFQKLVLHNHGSTQL